VTNLFPAIIGGLLGNVPYIPAIANLARSTLPVFDLTAKKDLFRVKRAKLRPLTESPANSLAFSSWRLAHAVKKADCTRPIAKGLAHVSALGFLLENGHLFEWGGADFRLTEDAISLLDDFSQSSLAGRIAQGIALL